jgi:ATP/maltotriose-dependent transcriptional regulator MalT
LDRIERVLVTGVSRMEEMQLWNTVATVAAYRGDVGQLSQFVTKAGLLTRGNREYDIYTRANEAMLSVLRGEKEQALRCFQSALTLAREGKNLLAVRQVISDMEALVAVGQKVLAGELAAWAKQDYIWEYATSNSSQETP